MEKNIKQNGMFSHAISRNLTKKKYLLISLSMWTRTFEGGGVSRVIYTLFISPLYSSKDKALPADLSPTTAGDQRDYGANGNESSTNAPSWWRNKRWRHDLTFMIVSPTAVATMAGSGPYAPSGGKQQWKTTDNTVTGGNNTITHRNSR